MFLLSLIDWFWYCRGKIEKEKQKTQFCTYKTRLFAGTFFGHSHLSIKQILSFVNLWVDNVQLKVISKQIEASETTCVDWASFCREVFKTQIAY